jgi:GT2 family glycosyltransferase
VLPRDASQLLHGRHAPLIAWAVSVGSGASFAVRKSVAQKIGGFDEALDQGRALPGGGDHDFFWRALSAGHELMYEPAALAFHEHRRDAKAMADQLIGHQRALIAFLCKSAVHGFGKQQAAILAFLAWRLAKPGHRLVRRMFGRDPLPAAVLARMWAGAIQGLWSYPVACRLAAKRRAAAEASS